MVTGAITRLLVLLERVKCSSSVFIQDNGCSAYKIGSWVYGTAESGCACEREREGGGIFHKKGVMFLPPDFMLVRYGGIADVLYPVSQLSCPTYFT